MNKTLENRTLALAGILQAVWLVQQAARRGLRSGTAIDASLQSIFVTDPGDAREVYAGGKGIAQGMDILKQQLAGRRQAHDMEITRYAISLMHLERRLAKRADMLKTIGAGIRDIGRQLAMNGDEVHAMIGRLADLYTETLSTLTPRILVNGDPDHLSNPATAQLIRALLLAGIRAAVLWRQCGGSRWRLLTERKGLMQIAENWPP